MCVRVSFALSVWCVTNQFVNILQAATHMVVKYNKKKGVKAQVFSVGDKVTIGIPRMDRAKTNLPRLPCEITEVFVHACPSVSLALNLCSFFLKTTGW